MPKLPEEAEHATFYKILCPNHGPIYLTAIGMEKAANRIKNKENDHYLCPRCQSSCYFDDEWFNYCLNILETHPVLGKRFITH